MENRGKEGVRVIRGLRAEIQEIRIGMKGMRGMPEMWVGMRLR